MPPDGHIRDWNVSAVTDNPRVQGPDEFQRGQWLGCPHVANGPNVRPLILIRHR